MEAGAHLLIQSGPDAGREIALTSPDGARMGRASSNDVVLSDPKTSRHHCRFTLRAGDEVWVSDLGSANRTLVNGSPIREVRLKTGDLIALGDSVLRVLPPSSRGPASATPGPAAAIDLGFGAQDSAAPATPRRRRGLLIGALATVVFIAFAAWLPRLLGPASDGSASAIPAGPVVVPALEIDYEKVLANTNRIFRYHLTLRPDLHLAVRIDDTDTTHLFEESTVAKALVEKLALAIENSGFLELADTYQGLQPGVYDQIELTVTLGPQTKRVRVLNRAEPDAFRAVREQLESFAQIELGLWAVQYPPEQLVRMAYEAYLDGRKRFDERQMAPGNVSVAIRRLKDADFYLKTIEPKPDFYPLLLEFLTTYNTELDQRYVDQNFLANRAVRTRDWQVAAQELRVLCAILDDRTDPRYDEARQRLVDVESRLNLQR